MACQIIYTLNALTLQLAREDRHYADVLLGADMTLADGVGAVWAIRCLTGRKVERVAGIDLIQDLCDVCAQEGQGVFFLGGAEGVAQKAAEQLQATLPRLRVVGTRNGFWHPSEEADIIDQINRSQAGLLLVGLGQPRQELFIDRYRQQLQVRVALGVGGSFDVLSGRLKRAPRWLRRLGLEWLFRLFQEPWRIRRLVKLPGLVSWVILTYILKKTIRK